MWVLTSRSDINNLKFGVKAACLQPGFHLPFVHFGNFASADFLLLFMYYYLLPELKSFVVMPKEALVN